MLNQGKREPDSVAKRILITGAHGFVAGNVIRQADPDCEWHALSRGSDDASRAGLHWHTLDLLDAAHLRRLFRAVQPEAVIHTAAIADIDYCEAHQNLAREVNVEVTRTLADLCAAGGAHLVFCSTDNVFDGEHAPYRELDPPRPLNFYGATKVEAEKIVSQLGKRSAIARLALVVGLPIVGEGNSFLAAMIARLEAGREVRLPSAEIRAPIDVVTVARALNELVARGHSGFFHLAGNERLSRFEMAQRIAARLGLPGRLIVAVDPGAMPDRAPRPRDVSLDNQRTRAELQTPMRSLDEGLALALESEKMR